MHPPEHYNIYCDESCHLENDGQSAMLLGAVWCPSREVEKNVSIIKEIKEKYRARGELKWTRISESRLDFFIEVVNYFFSTKNLNFRCLVVTNKANLDHSYYNQGSHDSFYYKMYFYLLRNILSAESQYSIYLDIKDTRSQIKINTLREILCNTFHDFDRKIIDRIQHARSKEIEFLQIADFLIGAISYNARQLSSSKSKLTVVRAIRELSGANLEHTTPPWEEKFNLFFFSPREVER